MAGRRPSGSRPHIGSVPSLSIWALNLSGWKGSGYGTARRAGALEYHFRGSAIGTASYEAAVGQESGTLRLEWRSEDAARSTTELIDIVSVPNAWGGRHWFFVCPATGRRARKLYRWPGVGFSHRVASPVPPTYACQRDSGRARVARAMIDIRKRLGGWPHEVEKPPGMPLVTFCRLNMRYMALNERFWRLSGSRHTH